MKEKILKYLNNKLEEVENEMVFSEEEFDHKTDKVELIKDIINDIENIGKKETTIMNEVWYDIEGYDRYKVTNMGKVVDTINKDYVEPILLDNRHCFVTLYKNDKPKLFKLSVLVFKYVLGINKDTYYVMYKDNNPYNCSIDNIYEIHYSHRARKKLDKKDVEDIYIATKHMKVKLIAEIYDLPTSTIYSIKNKKSYKDITDFIDLQEAMKEGYVPDLLKF